MDNFIDNRFFKSLNELPDQIYGLKMSKNCIEHKETVLGGFFILQYVNLTLLQLKYNSFSSFCDPNKYELIEMDTNSLYMALSEDKVDKIIRPEMQSLWYWMRQSDRAYNFAANSSSHFSHENVAISMLPLIREHLVFLWRIFVVPRCLLCAQKRTAFTMSKQT